MSEHDAFRIWNEYFSAEWPSHNSRAYRIACFVFFGIMGILCSFLVPWIINVNEWGITIILMLRIPGALLGIIIGMLIVATRDYIKKRGIIRRFQEKHPEAFDTIGEVFARRGFPE